MASSFFLCVFWGDCTKRKNEHCIGNFMDALDFDEEEDVLEPPNTQGMIEFNVRENCNPRSVIPFVGFLLFAPVSIIALVYGAQKKHKNGDCWHKKSVDLKFAAPLWLLVAGSIGLFTGTLLFVSIFWKPATRPSRIRRRILTFAWSVLFLFHFSWSVIGFGLYGDPVLRSCQHASMTKTILSTAFLHTIGSALSILWQCIR